VFAAKFDGIITASRDKRLPISAFDMKVNDVCKPCNEGWLEQKVETPAENAIIRLMNGLPLFINNANAKIYLCGSKTAAVRALIDPGHRAIPPEHYNAIRIDLVPPPGTLVWLANIQYCSDMLTRHLRVALKDDDQLALVTHVTTFLLGNLGLYVMGASNPAQSEEVFHESQRRLAMAGALKIWPNAVSTVGPAPRNVISLPLADQLSNYFPPNGVGLEGESWLLK
jgi:hypothetical protein